MNKLMLDLAELTVEAFPTSDAEQGLFGPTKVIDDCSADSCGHICP